mgnify:CR=1 FL=1
MFPDVIVARHCKDECDDHFEILYMPDLKMDVGYYRDRLAGTTSRRQTYREKAEDLLKNLAMLEDVPPLRLTTKVEVKRCVKPIVLRPDFIFPTSKSQLR